MFMVKRSCNPRFKQLSITNIPFTTPFPLISMKINCHANCGQFFDPLLRPFPQVKGFLTPRAKQKLPEGRIFAEWAGQISLICLHRLISDKRFVIHFTALLKITCCENDRRYTIVQKVAAIVVNNRRFHR